MHIVPFWSWFKKDEKIVLLAEHIQRNTYIYGRVAAKQYVCKSFSCCRFLANSKFI
jgi:hypothetical protein